MVNKKRTFHTFIIFLILSLLCSGLYAQTKKFTQKLEWQREPNALEYKVDIQGVTDSSTSKLITTKDPYVTFSMPAGEYRYRVIAYDFLGRQASVTEWKTFTITKALQPKVSLLDTSITVDKNQKKPVTIPVEVGSITDESTLTFVNIETGEKIEGHINFAKAEDGTGYSSSVVFPEVSVGEWKMVVENPSGLSTESEPVVVAPAGKKLIIGRQSIMSQETEPAQEEIKEIAALEPEPEVNPEPASEQENEVEVVEDSVEEKKPHGIKNINVMAGFTSPFIIYDDFLKSFDGQGFNPGANVRVSWFTSNEKILSFGGELNFVFAEFKDENQYQTAKIPFLSSQLNAVLRINFLSGKLGLNIRAGGGVTLLGKEIKYNDLRPDVDMQLYGYMSVMGGLSVTWIPFKHLIAEAGVDYTHVFIPDLDAGFILPYVALGVRF